MAGIDKTYVKTWSEYKEIRDWAISVGTVTDDYGNKFTPFNFLYYPNLSEGEFYKSQANRHAEILKKYNEDPDWFSYYIEREGGNFDTYINNPENWFDVIVWNTGTLFDIYLMRHCPIKVIQDTLAKQYSKYYINNVMNYTSEFDLFKRTDNKNPHFNIDWIIDNNYKDDKIWWFIEAYDKENDDAYKFPDYYEKSNTWKLYNDPVIPDSGRVNSVCDCFHGNMPVRKIYRLLRKWNLPKGFKLKFSGMISIKNESFSHMVIKEFIVTVK